MKLIKIFAASLVVIVAMPLNVAAQVVTALDPTTPVVVNSVPNPTLGAINTGHTGESGYDFFAATTETGPTVRADVSDLPTFVTSVDTDLTSYDAANAMNYTTLEYPGSYSQLTIAGATYGTGELYYNVGNQGAIVSAPLAKIALGSGVPSSFDLGLLQQDSSVETLNVGLYNAAGDLLNAANATGTLQAGQSSVNNFFYADVSGAAAGDYLLVSGTGHYQVTLGGVAFDTPEPSTYALMFTGLGFVILLARSRRARA